MNASNVFLNIVIISRGLIQKDLCTLMSRRKGLCHVECVYLQRWSPLLGGLGVL